MKCYLCDSDQLRVIRNQLRYNVQRNVLKCDQCGLVFLEPKAVDLAEYYKGDYRTQYSPVVGKRMTPRELFEMNLPFQASRVGALGPVLRPDMRVLDVGCSAGFFLHALRPHVDECIGIEFNRDDAAFVNDELGIKTYSTPIDETDLEPGSLDLITLFHVLEHIEDPIPFLEQLRPYLKPDGWLFLEVPNVDDALLSLYDVEPYANFWYREPHVFNFSPTTLLDVCKRAGFDGQSFTFQRYSLLNHINWMIAGKPQPSMVVGMGAPSLIPADASVSSEVRSDLDQWLMRINEEYKKLLDKHGRGDCVRFLGQAMDPR